MRKALALAAFLAMAPYAQAQEAASAGTFTPNAEFRMRFQYDQNVEADKDLEPTSRNAFQHRMKFGGTFKASDKLSMTFTGINSATWGSDPGTGIEAATVNNVGDRQNMLLIQEAYATWMASDEFTIRAGRGSLTLSDGSVISSNDWEQDPYAFEGILGTYEMEMGRVSAWFVRFVEFDGIAAPAAPTDQDPEANSFALAYSHKTLPEFLKAADIHVMKNTKSALASAAVYTGALAAGSDLSGKDELRYGIHLAGDVSLIDFKVNYAAHTGDKKFLGTPDSVKREGMMYEAEVGANFEEFMKSRVYVYYHQDSGKNANSTTEKDQLYDPFYYEKHENAGLMDVVGWGNLTQMSVGYSMEPMDATTVSLHYHMFQKTDGDGPISSGLYGDSISGITSTKKDIGQEIDLVGSHKYDNGLTMTARLGMFMPGDAMKDAANTTQHEDTYSAAFLEAKMNF